nr:MAG TPA: hypothetical protein [Caudoviricetes sp.]
MSSTFLIFFTIVLRDLEVNLLYLVLAIPIALFLIAFYFYSWYTFE